jgi:outer membrane usher protein
VLGALAKPAMGAELASALIEPAANAISFEDGFINAGYGPRVDISRFERANAVLPGDYRSDAYLNGEWRARINLRIADVEGMDTAQLCLDRATLQSIGIDLRKVEAEEHGADGRKSVPTEGGFCGPLGDYVPGATATFDPSNQSVSFSVPQVYVDRNARGYVDPKYWDEGINAAAINYTANLYRSSLRGSGGRLNGYVGVNASANFGSWHLTHQSSFTWTEGRRRTYQTAANYLQHDIPSLMSQLYVGDFYTSGNLFDSVNLRGAGLVSDERMLPQSLRGYAPTVRGVAETNARVVIRQRGYVLLDTSVAPGPFAIDDLYPTGFGGDLDVEVNEADGRVKRFVVPYAAVPQLLRAGQSRWEAAAGKVREDGKKNTPIVGTATYQRGISDYVTTYGGVTLASGYNAALIGGALNTKVGAISLDVSRSHASLPGASSQQGASVRVTYNKNLPTAGTNFALAAYRYSTKGYVSLSDLTDLRDAQANGTLSVFDYSRLRARSQLTASINQRLGQEGGQLFLTGTRRDYWSGAGRQVDFTVGYSNHWKTINYSLSAQRTQETVLGTRLPGGPINEIPGAPTFGTGTADRLTRRDTRVFLSVSVPLGSATGSPNLNVLAERSSYAGKSAQIGLNGTAGDEQEWSYNTTLGRQGGETSFAASGQYNSGHGNVRAGYSQGSGYKQVNAGIAGGLVLHGGGQTWSPPLGETIGLVYVPDAAGARVASSQRSVVDTNHFAVVPNLIPYQLNRVAIDPKGMSLDTELQESSQQVAPRARSVVRLDYKTVSGRTMLIESSLNNGDALPFGAEVFDDQGKPVGVTGQGGQILVRGVEKPGELTVRWGDGEQNMCRIQINPDASLSGSKSRGMDRYQAPCQLNH